MSTTCIKCGKDATKRCSPDLDLEGFGMCDEHESEIKNDLMIAMFTDWKAFEKKYLSTEERKHLKKMKD